jgi:hypothetical protein
VLDDNDLEARLRDALSRSAPLGLPTIGVRERVVAAVRTRRARRQRIAGGLAAACLVVAGVTLGLTGLHSATNPGRAAAGAAASPHSNPIFGAPEVPVPRAGCGEITVGDSVVGDCSGAFGRTPAYATTPTASGPVAFSESKPGKDKTSTGTSGGGTGGAGVDQGAAGDEVVVPVGRPVTVLLPGSAGHIWTAPEIVPGQGTDASRVTVITARVSGAGKGSSASFESPVAVTVVVEASALGTCGAQHTPCGMPTSYWSVVLEFRAG